MLLAYDKVCLSDVLSKWKQGIADGDVVISHNPLEKLENPYLPFVGKQTKIICRKFFNKVLFWIVCFDKYHFF